MPLSETGADPDDRRRVRREGSTRGPAAPDPLPGPPPQAARAAPVPGFAPVYMRYSLYIQTPRRGRQRSSAERAGAIPGPGFYPRTRSGGGAFSPYTLPIIPRGESEKPSQRPESLGSRDFPALRGRRAKRSPIVMPCESLKNRHKGRGLWGSRDFPALRGRRAKRPPIIVPGKRLKNRHKERGFRRRAGSSGPPGAEGKRPPIIVPGKRLKNRHKSRGLWGAGAFFSPGGGRRRDPLFIIPGGSPKSRHKGRDFGEDRPPAGEAGWDPLGLTPCFRAGEPENLVKYDKIEPGFFIYLKFFVKISKEITESSRGKPRKGRVQSYHGSGSCRTRRQKQRQI